MLLKSIVNFMFLLKKEIYGGHGIFDFVFFDNYCEKVAQIFY